MIKKLLYFCAISVAILFPTVGSALRLNVTLGADIVTHKDRMNADYVLYYNGTTATGETEDTDQEAFNLWLQAFNREYQEITPIKSDGKDSFISFGYRKGQQDFYPASCNHIILTNKKTVDIVLTEQGCNIN